jgi:hypothetical protein
MIEKVVARWCPKGSDYEIVSDVAARATELGCRDSNPFRSAKCLRRSDGTVRILLLAELGDDEIEPMKSAMILRGFKEEVGRLLTSEGMLFHHLLLHEVACAVLETDDQGARDRWAFDRLKEDRD